MPEGFTTFHGVVRSATADSGKAIQVYIDGKQHWIPAFAIHDDSEVCLGAGHESGTLIIQTNVAEEKGLAQADSRGTGVGIPLKRNRLPDPPELLPVGQVKDIESRWDASSGDGWENHGCDVYRKGTTDTLGMFSFSKDAEFAAHAPEDIRALLDENARLRTWVTAALKTQERRVAKK